MLALISRGSSVTADLLCHDFWELPASLLLYRPPTVCILRRCWHFTTKGLCEEIILTWLTLVLLCWCLHVYVTCPQVQTQHNSFQHKSKPPGWNGIESDWWYTRECWIYFTCQWNHRGIDVPAGKTTELILRSMKFNHQTVKCQHLRWLTDFLTSHDAFPGQTGIVIVIFRNKYTPRLLPICLHCIVSDLEGTDANNGVYSVCIILWSHGGNTSTTCTHDKPFYQQQLLT